jgi:hypothetical protein
MIRTLNAFQITNALEAEAAEMVTALCACEIVELFSQCE